MSTTSIIILCIAIYIVIGLIVGLVTRNVVKGIFWIVYILGDILEGLDGIDLDL